MNESQSLQLLKESILATGKYSPTQDFLGAASVGILVNKTPVLLIGFGDDPSAHQIADRLLACPEFIHLIHYIFEDDADHISKGIVVNSNFTQESYPCVMTSVQGRIEDGYGVGKLEAIALEAGEMLAFSICINSAIMRCFHPESTPLSFQIDLKDKV